MSQEHPNTIEQYPPTSPMSSVQRRLLHEEEYFITAALSRPPSYMMQRDTTSFTVDEQSHSEMVQELAEYYNRQNIRNSYLDRLLFWNTSEENEQEKIKYKYAVQSCISSQFRGTAMLIWILILIFVGCISIFTGPKGSQVLWVILGVYLIFVIISFRNRRKEDKRIVDLERCIMDQRVRRRELLDQSHSLPEGYYFEIQNRTKNHTHPVVTLLPPPPAYGN
jgi:hypothetical protein